MEVKVDSVWQPAPFFFMADSLMPRQYQILADWQPEQEYQLTIDSLAFTGIYEEAHDNGGTTTYEKTDLFDGSTGKLTMGDVYNCLALLRKTRLRWMGKLMHSPMIMATM